MTTERQSMGGESEYITPKLHLGGTPRKMLEDGYHKAYAANLAAQRAMAAIEFNQRDYPDPDEWEGAKLGRDVAIDHLRQNEAYLVEIINAIDGWKP